MSIPFEPVQVEPIYGVPWEEIRQAGLRRDYAAQALKNWMTWFIWGKPMGEPEPEAFPLYQHPADQPLIVEATDAQ